MSVGKSFSDRRFQRIHLHWDESSASEVLGVKAQLSASAGGPGQPLKVFDLGLAGAALERRGLEVQKGQTLEVQFFLPTQKEPILCRAEVVWLGEKSFGLRFVGLEPKDRLTFNDYLQDQLIGAALTKVDGKFFSADLGCQFWYHGPKETNVFLWTEETGVDQGPRYLIHRAEIQLDEDWFFYDRGQFFLSLKGEERTQLEAVHEPFFRRVIHLLSQVPQQRGPLGDLLNQLVESRPQWTQGGAS